MKGKKLISFFLATAMTISAFGGLGLTVSAAESTAYSWSFEDGTDGLTISNDDLIKVEDLDAGQLKTEAASPSGQVLYIGSKGTTGTGNAYVTLPKDAFVDESGKIKDEFQVSFDINSTDNGWRYAFYVGDGTTANSLYFVPAGAVVGGSKPVYGTRAEVFGKGATKDSRVMTLNKWVHVDIIKKGNTFVAYEDGERFGVLDSDAVASLSGDVDQMFAAMGYSPHNDPGLNAYIDNLTIYNTVDEQLLNRAKTLYYCYWDTETTGTKSQAGTDSSTEVYSDAAGQRFLLETDGNLSTLDSVSISNGWDSGSGNNNTCTINVYALIEKPVNLGSADLQNPVGTFVQSKDFSWGYLTGKALITGDIPEGAKYLVVTQENSGGGTTRVYAEYICLSYKEKEPQPEITVNYMAETLDGFITGGEYAITADGGINDTETISEGTTLPIKDTYFGKTIEIVKKGDGDVKGDSDAQSLSVPARPVVPELTVNQPSTIGGKGSISGVDITMEYSVNGGTNWTKCTGTTIDDLESGEVLIRIAATLNSFKSDTVSKTISKFGATQETKPSITIDFENEKLTGFVADAKYTINGTEIIPTETAVDIDADWLGKTLSIIKKGNTTTTTDSDAQSLEVPVRPSAPENLTGVAPTTPDGKGSITGIDATMEYRAKATENNGAWAAYPADGVAPGEYEVRTKATNEAFASAAAIVTVGSYVAPEPEKDYSKRLFYANFDDGEIAAKVGKITNSSASVTEDNGNKVANLSGSAHMAITKDDNSPILKGLETASIHMRAKATGANKTDWYFFAAGSSAAPTGGSEKYIGAFNNSSGVINFERYKGGRDNKAVTVNSAKNEWHDLDFLFNEKTMEIYVDGKFQKGQSHDDVKLSDILGSEDTQIFYIGKATWGSGEYMTGMVDDISVYGIAPIVDIENKSITDTIVLPTAETDAGYSVKWTSDNTGIINISDEGEATVTQPAADTAVKLTAQITYGDITISKDITVTVQGQSALAVTIDPTVAGNVTVDKTEAHLGDEINVTVTAPEGKVLKDVKAGDTSILTSGRKGAYKFNMPATDVIVTAEFEEKKQTAIFHFEDGTADGIRYVQNGSAGAMEFAEGKTGKALKLTPSAKNGYYGQLDKFPLALNFSVGAWIKPADVNTWWQRVFDFGIGEGNSIFVTTLGEAPSSGTSGTYRVDAFGTGIDSPKKLTANEWAYITVTYDEASDTLTLYLNGESVGTATCTKNMAEAYGGAANYIGKSQYAADSLYSGLIDEMVIYNYAITPDEIKELMGTTPTPAEPTTAPTANPTPTAPTTAPTVNPTPATPTTVPTVNPTPAEPTTAPTAKPTPTEPTTVPTANPTPAEPTTAPTANPTPAAPTTTPTANPTPAGNHSISGKVTNHDGSAAENIKLTLMPLGWETTTDSNGDYTFDNVEKGNYNIIAEYSDGKILTFLVQIETRIVFNIKIPTRDINCWFEIKGDNTPKDILVGGLDILASELSKNEDSDAVLDVKMTVERKSEDNSDKAQQEIRKKSNKDKLDYIDIAVTKTVDNKKDEIAETPNLLSIIIPFVTEGKNNIQVYRYHNGVAEAMLSSDQTVTTGRVNENERYEVGDGFVRIYAKKFSTYAIAYDEETHVTPTPDVTPTPKPSTSSGGSGRSKRTPAPAATPKPTATPTSTSSPESTAKPDATANPVNTPAPGTSDMHDDTFPFTDVNVMDWYYDAVKTAYEYGFVSGVTDTEFAPDMMLTRGMLAAILGRMDGAPQTVETNEYTDIDRNSYYAPYVAWGTANGILNGFGDGTFRPDEALTREQAARIIKGYYDYKDEISGYESAIIPDYSDFEQISDWALDGVAFCAAKNIMTGRDNGMFDPKANITRAEIASIISRMK